jgi:hypothetical protein
MALNPQKEVGGLGERIWSSRALVPERHADE